jgi:hypothetical protein
MLVPLQVDSFLGRKGKFAISGYPHKLGFLLHGPPGTGGRLHLAAPGSCSRCRVAAGLPHSTRRRPPSLHHPTPHAGKTTFIKALAQYTGRSIISIPLERIATNQELMDMMFDQEIYVAGEWPARGQPENLLFM